MNDLVLVLVIDIAAVGDTTSGPLRPQAATLGGEKEETPTSCSLSLPTVMPGQESDLYVPTDWTFARLSGLKQSNYIVMSVTLTAVRERCDESQAEVQNHRYLRDRACCAYDHTAKPLWLDDSPHADMRLQPIHRQQNKSTLTRILWAARMGGKHATYVGSNWIPYSCSWTATGLRCRGPSEGCW